MTEPTRARFDELMAGLDPPMAVVTVASSTGRAGCLVGFHSQCGIVPPVYAVWLSKANRTYEVAATAEWIAVHFLGPDDKSIAELFGAETGDDIDKFARCSWTEGEGGVPLLDGCPTRLVGRRRALIDPGTDHAALLVDVIRVTGTPPESLLHLEQVADLAAGHPPSDPRPQD